MPREYVGEDPQKDGSITVRWGREDGIVQLSVAGPVGWRDEYVSRKVPSGDPVYSVNEIRALEVDFDNGLDWHMTINHRREINRLIRLLRTARDQAFGKDE